MANWNFRFENENENEAAQLNPECELKVELK